MICHRCKRIGYPLILCICAECWPAIFEAHRKAIESIRINANFYDWDAMTTELITFYKFIEIGKEARVWEKKNPIPCTRNLESGYYNA